MLPRRTSRVRTIDHTTQLRRCFLDGRRESAQSLTQSSHKPRPSITRRSRDALRRTATELCPELNKKGITLEDGLGPYVDDDEEGAEEDASKITEIGKVAAKASLKDVGFKPIRSPLSEHQTSLAGALLNKSVGKGSAKFKKASADGAADSKGIL